MQAPIVDRQGRGTRPERRLAYALIACLLVILPTLVVAYPPITDLPQQLAQIPLAGETLAGSAPEYRLQWWTPNRLSYPLLSLAWLAPSPAAAARLATALVAAIWVLALHWMAARRGRPVAAAVLAGLLLFNHVFYLGLFNFILGMPVFLFWLEMLEHQRQTERHPLSTALRSCAGALLLYMAHALWLVAGLVWLALVTLWDRRPLRWQLATAAGLTPTLLLVVIWYPSLGDAGWGSLSSYGPSAVSRLSFAGLTNSTLGGLRGWIEPLAVLLLLLWVGIGLWQQRRALGDAVDRRLLAAALLFLLVAVLLPEKVDRTLRFASRWMPAGWTLLLLALPPPAIRAPLRRLTAVALLAVFCASTAVTWIGFNRDELRGLDAALASLPAEPRVLGLDFVRQSPRMKQPVYMHLNAYAQLLRAGRLNFSFVSLASALVVKTDLARPDPWSQGLEWEPRLLRPSDLDHFDFALIHAPPAVLANLQEQEDRLQPLTPPAPWSLLRVARRPIGG